MLISTDKAVNPKTVMGQSKALCEWIVEAYGAREDIADPLRRGALRQRARLVGQRDPDLPPPDRERRPGHGHAPGDDALLHDDPRGGVARVQAGAIGGRGEVFVLDMGEPVRILDLAKQMIRLSGKEPERDIAIEIVGTRPGEKLHEELWGEGETAEATTHPKIMRVSGPTVDAVWLQDELAELERLVREGETLEVVSRLGDDDARASARRRDPCAEKTRFRNRR